MHELELNADPPRSKGLCLLPPVQRQFGRYVLLCRFATGGMANLYLARVAGPGGFNKLVAIKRIHEHLTEDEQFVNMFVDEARLAARIEHPNVVQVIELGAVGTSYFIAMEYVAGESLVAVLKRTGPSLPVSARIISQAALGLHAAHELKDTRGEPLHVVHRDVSPGNILLSYSGVVKVADFGVARARTNIHTTSAGTVKGKFAYMAPEQARSAAIDRRSDVFALGIVLYEMSTRRRLFKAESEMVTMAKVLNEPITPPSKIVSGYPPELEEIVMRALQRDRERRFQTAEALHEALEAYIRRCDVPVLQSSISDMMHGAFADRIGEKEQLLRRCDDELSGSVRDLSNVEGPSASSFGLDGTASAARLVRRRRVRLLWLALAALLSLGLIAGYGLLYSDEDVKTGLAPMALSAAKGGEAVPRATRRTVKVSIQVTPATATIDVDGRRVANPYVAETAPEARRATVVASAPGYATRQIDLPLDESSRLVIALEQERATASKQAPSKPVRAARARLEKGQRGNKRAGAPRRRKGVREGRGAVDGLFENPYAR